MNYASASLPASIVLTDTLGQSDTVWSGTVSPYTPLSLTVSASGLLTSLAPSDVYENVLVGSTKVFSEAWSSLAGTCQYVFLTQSTSTATTTLTIAYGNGTTTTLTTNSTAFGSLSGSLSSLLSSPYGKWLLFGAIAFLAIILLLILASALKS
mgnify:CR=1 FL=1